MSLPEENALLHFTGAKNAALILGASTLNFGGLGNSNDLSESPRLLDLLGFMGDAKAEEAFVRDTSSHSQLVRAIQSMGFICLSKFFIATDNNGDRLLQDPNRFELMMGHYASKGQGICLMFDKLNFIEELKYRGNDAEFHTVANNDVAYNDVGGIWDLSTLNDYRELASGENLARLFIKREIWKNEKEYRVVRVPNAKKSQSEIPPGVTFNPKALIGFAHCTLGAKTYPWTAEAQMYIDACKHSQYKLDEYEFSPHSRCGQYLRMSKGNEGESSPCKFAEPIQPSKGLHTVGC